MKTLPMIKRYMPFTIQVLRLNLAISPIIAFFFVILSKPFIEIEITVEKVIYFFLLSFTTGGFIIGVLFFEFTRSREYYFYYNFGISKPKLFAVSYLIHLLIALVIIIIAVNVK